MHPVPTWGPKLYLDLQSTPNHGPHPLKLGQSPYSGCLGGPGRSKSYFESLGAPGEVPATALGADMNVAKMIRDEELPPSVVKACIPRAAREEVTFKGSKYIIKHTYLGA